MLKMLSGRGSFFGHKEAQKIIRERRTLRRAYRRAGVINRSLKRVLRIFAANRMGSQSFLTADVAEVVTKFPGSALASISVH
jgi:hypothetical protein